MSFCLLILYVSCCYLRPADLYPDLAPYRPMLCLAALTALAVLLETLMTRRRLRSTQYWLLAALTVAVALSRVAQGWLGGALLALEDFAVPVSVFYLVALSITSIQRLRILAAVLLATFSFLTVQALSGFTTGSEQYFVRQSSDNQDAFRRDFNKDDQEYMGSEATNDLRPLKRIRSLGFLSDPNDFSQALIVGLPLLGRMWARRRILQNILVVVIPAALFLVTIYFSHSRGALVGLAILGLLAVKDRWGAIPAFVCAIFTGLIALGEKLAGSHSISIDPSAYGRIDAWSAGLEMLKAQPVFGVGYNFFTDHNELTAHNSFVLCFSELGLVGYFIWLAILIVTGHELFRFNERELDASASEALGWAKALSYSLCGFLATAFFLSRTYTITLYLILGLSVGLTSLYQYGGSSAGEPSIRYWVKWTSALEGVSILLVYLVVRFGHAVGIGA